MIGHLLAMVLTACDTRKNPAAKQVANQFSNACDAFGDLARSLCESSSPPTSVSYQPTNRASVPHLPASLKYSKMRHRQVPDFSEGIRTVVAELHRKYKAQQRDVEENKRQITLHEGINLEKLNCEIQELQDEIEKFQSSEDALRQQRKDYRAEGLLRNVCVHGVAQYSLSRQIGKLREKMAASVAKQEAARALVDQRKSFDFAQAREALRVQDEELNAIGQDYKKQKDFLDDFNRQMKSFVDQVSDTARRLNMEIDRYNTLSLYEAKLNASANAYERRLVHQECEASFGDGSVGRLRSRVLSKIRELSARYDKQTRQAENHARTIGLLG